MIIIDNKEVAKVICARRIKRVEEQFIIHGICNFKSLTQLYIRTNQ